MYVLLNTKRVEIYISHGLSSMWREKEKKRKETTVTTMGKSGISCRNYNKEVKKVADKGWI